MRTSTHSCQPQCRVCFLLLLSKKLTAIVLYFHDQSELVEPLREFALHNEQCSFFFFFLKASDVNRTLKGSCRCDQTAGLPVAANL